MYILDSWFKDVEVGQSFEYNGIIFKRISLQMILDQGYANAKSNNLIEYKGDAGFRYFQDARVVKVARKK